MKKLLLVAALGVAGLVSANENVKKVEVKNKSKEVVITKKNQKKEKKVENDCATIVASCGATGWVCGESRTWERFIEIYEALENIYCN